MFIISLATDFGDLYPAAMKAVILGINPNVQIIDIIHSILRARIREGAFALYSLVPYFPAKSVHVGPGVTKYSYLHRETKGLPGGGTRKQPEPNFNNSALPKSYWGRWETYGLCEWTGCKRVIRSLKKISGKRFKKWLK